MLINVYSFTKLRKNKRWGYSQINTCVDFFYGMVLFIKKCWVEDFKY